MCSSKQLSSRIINVSSLELRKTCVFSICCISGINQTQSRIVQLLLRRKPRWIKQIDRIIPDIRIQIRPTTQPNRVRLQEPAQVWVVVSGVDVVESGLSIIAVAVADCI